MPSRNKNTPPSEQAQDALNKAKQIADALRTEDAFHHRLVRKGLTPGRDAANVRYWQLFSDYSGERVDDLRKKGYDPRLMDSIEIVAAAPHGILAQAILRDKNARRHAPEGTRAAAKRANRLAARYAKRYPDTPAELLADTTAEFTGHVVPIPGLVNVANLTGRAIVNHGQFSNAFDHMATLADRDVFDSPDAEGPRTDYVVYNGIYIDPLSVHVAQSLSHSRAPLDGSSEEGHHSLHDGIATVYPPVLPRDFGGRLGLPPATVEQRAPHLDHMLTEAERDMLGGTALRYGTESKGR